MSIRQVLTMCRWLLVTSIVLALSLTFVVAERFTSVMLILIPAMGYALVGFVVSARRPKNAIGWIFLLVGLLGSLIYLANVGVDATLAAAQPPAGEPFPWWSVLAAWGYNLLWFPTMMLITTFTFLLFPSGLPTSRWRPILWLAVLSTVTVTALLAMNPALEVGDLQKHQITLTISNPLSPWAARAGQDGLPWWVQGLLAMSLFCAVASIVAVLMRIRRSRDVERQQMRMFAFAATLFAVQITLSALTDSFGNSEVDELSFAFVMTSVPVACGLAILRYHLYDIDRIIGRTTAYVIVTGLLLAVFFVVVTLVAQLLPEQSSSFAVAAATLAAAALFRPALTRVQAYVDRRFNRSRYDAQRTVEAFAGRLRDEVTPDAVRADLLAVLGATVQPSGAALWLKEGAP